MSHSAKSVAGSGTTVSLDGWVVDTCTGVSGSCVIGTSCDADRSCCDKCWGADDSWGNNDGVEVSTTVTSTDWVVTLSPNSEPTVVTEVTDVVIESVSDTLLEASSAPGDCNGVAFGVGLAELWNQSNRRLSYTSGLLLSPSFMP